MADRILYFNSQMNVQWILNKPTPSVRANKVSDYELSDYWVKLYRKYSTSPINYPLKPVGLCNVGLLGIGLSSIHFILMYQDYRSSNNVIFYLPPDACTVCPRFCYFMWPPGVMASFPMWSRLSTASGRLTSFRRWQTVTGLDVTTTG